MALPKIDLPKYKTTLPVSGQEVTYRPYTVKEEKILMMAAQSTNESDSLNAIIQVLENCTAINVSELHTTDLEWLYIKVRSASAGSTVDVKVSITKDCEGSGDTPCPGEILTGINLDYVEVERPMEFPMKGKDYIVMLTNDIGVAFRPRSADTDDYVFSCVEYTFDAETVYPKASFTKEEFVEWIDAMDPQLHEKIEEFFENQPNLYYNLKAKCHVCGFEYFEKISGIDRFFV